MSEGIPVSVITGFLGSGKTTVLRHLLSLPEMGETAVVINEFGEIGLDHTLVESSREDTVMLNSGCLCCTVRGDLVKTLQSLAIRRVRGEVTEFKRLVIETTGLADPAPILHTLMNDPILARDYRLDGVIAVVDGANGLATLDAHPESVKQAAVADRLLLSKSDIAKPGEADALEDRLRKLNPAAPIVRSAQGVVSPARIFGAGLYNPETKTADVQGWLKAEAYKDAERGHEGSEDHGHDHHHGHHHHDVNRHDEAIHAFALERSEPVDWDKLADWMEMLVTLYGARILRIKGLVNVAGEDKPVVLHGVQHVFHPPARLDAWPKDSERRTQIVFIVNGLETEMFRYTMAAFLDGEQPAQPN